MIVTCHVTWCRYHVFAYMIRLHLPEHCCNLQLSCSRFVVAQVTITAVCGGTGNYLFVRLMIFSKYSACFCNRVCIGLQCLQYKPHLVVSPWLHFCTILQMLSQISWHQWFSGRLLIHYRSFEETFTTFLEYKKLSNKFFFRSLYQLN